MIKPQDVLCTATFDFFSVGLSLNSGLHACKAVDTKFNHKPEMMALTFSK
jgi:hypothetical protein